MKNAVGFDLEWCKGTWLPSYCCSIIQMRLERIRVRVLKCRFTEEEKSVKV